MVAGTRTAACAQRRRDNGGASAVEFALISLLLLTLLFGMLQYGFYFWQRQGASAAAQEAARASSVGKWGCGTSTGQFQREVADAIPYNLSDPDLSVTRTYTSTGGGPTSAPAVGDEVTVNVSFPAMDIGIVPLPNGGTILADSTARLENKTTMSVPC